MTSSERMGELEKRFSELESRIEDSPEKEAISILHAMLMQNRRENTAPDGEDPRIDVVANLYKTAPAMEGKAENEGLPEGRPAPEFSLPGIDGELVSLSDFRGKNVILAFYPLDWSPGCSDQMSLYQAELDEFERYDAQVIGISVDSIYSHGAWTVVRDFSIPLLSDFHPKGEVARRYRVMRESDGFSERALYVIDKNGNICFKQISPELHHVPDIYELFGVLEGLQEG